MSPREDDFTYPTSNKQLAFLEHIYRGLLPEGRAAVVLPDNVLSGDGEGRSIRADLMDKCNLHTILRLPTGIFYAQSIKTNALFFQRGTTEKGNTKEVWIYDLRTNMPSFGKRTPLTRKHFTDFEQCYGSDPNGKSPRTDLGEEGRFRCFSGTLTVFTYQKGVKASPDGDLTSTRLNRLKPRYIKNLAILRLNY